MEKNLLEETIEELKNNGLTPDDVKWVGNAEVRASWENFTEIANVEYDDGYGGQVVAKDLLVVGRDWWLERHEYDGSEWWEFKRLPKKPDIEVRLKRLIDDDSSWRSLKEMNDL